MNDELLNEFIYDSRDHLNVAGAQLLDLEKSPHSLAALNALMGTLHTIKGNSGFLDLPNLYQLLHHAENLLQTIREKQCPCPQKTIDLLLQVLDTVEAVLERLESGENDSVDWLGSLNQALNESENDLTPAPAAVSAPAPGRASDSPARAEAPACPAPPRVAPGESLAGKINTLALKDGQLAEEDDLFPSRIEAMFAAGLKGLVVDLRTLGSVTSRELKTLMAAGKKNPAQTSFLLDAASQESLYRVFRVLHLDSFMHFFTDEEAARAHILNDG